MSTTDDKTSAPLTAADRLAREPLDRLLGRFTVEQRAQLSYIYANRAVRTHAPAVLEHHGLGAMAGQLRALAEIADDASATAARDLARKLQEQADAERTKEEQSGRSNGPGTQASHAMSFAVASVKAALGETGLKVAQMAGATAPGAVKKEPVDTGVQRALLAGKYGINLAKLLSEQAAADEETTQRSEALAVLKAPRRI